ncbi:nucleoporin like [Fagus crenata]
MATTKSVDASLWWDPFSLLLTDLESAPLSSDLPPNLAKKLKENRDWFVDTVSRFKSPNEKSKEALNSEVVKIGAHQLTIQSELKEKALRISSYLCLDEVQSYIIVERSLKDNNLGADSIVQECIHVIMLQYYMERQCLLKCTRRILMHALYVGTDSKEGQIIREEALKLISDGLERKSISVLEDLLSSSHPEQMDVDLFTLWAEETLIEDNLVLDILFLTYYESFCTCNGERWKKLCSLYKGILSGACNFGKLAISSEALHSSYHAKIQLLLILIETLDLEILLQMVHDEMPFRNGFSVFTLTDVQEMDAIISSFNAFELKEAGPLILAWAVFLCLISSLPGKEENDVLMEIDHVGYVRQAFEAASLSYFLEIVQSDILKESDGPVAGYRSVLRTFISAFIASYEINLQMGDSNLNLILDILCKIYRGEESLCVQFWDKESFIDGPIRCLLCNLEGEFPFRTVELVRLLSSLCEGTWPAECVYNFLDKSVGISSLFEINSDSLVDNISQIVGTHLPVHVPGVEGLFIPSKTRGHVLKVIGGNTALVRWEYTQSGVLVLLLRLAQDLYPDKSEEVFLTLDLLCRMVSFNTDVCFAFMEIGSLLHLPETGMTVTMEKNVWAVEIICTLVRNLSPNSSSAALMSMGVKILGKVLKCSPSHVAAVALKANIFDLVLETSIRDIGGNSSSSGSWLLSGKLAKMLLIDCEQNDNDYPLAISVLDFTMQLVETGLEDDSLLALIVFSLQYILVSHEYWKYKVKYVRWKVTLKVLEVMKKCIMSVSYFERLGDIIRDLLLCDSSIHNALFRIICTTKQSLENLYSSRLFELMEIEGLQLAIGAVLDILFIMLSNFSKDVSSSLSVFHQAVLSCTTKPVPVAAAVTSLISYFRNPAIQVGAARIADLRHSINHILLEQSVWNEDLFVATVNLLTSAAHYQPAFLVDVFAAKESTDVQCSNVDSVKQPANEASFGPQGSKKSSLVDALLHYVDRASNLINSNPRILLNVLNLMKALWQGAAQYTQILLWLRSSENFWKQLSNTISQIAGIEDPPLENLTEMGGQNFAYKYRCQSAILEIIAYEMFLQKKLSHAESLVKHTAESKNRIENAVNIEKSNATKDIMSNWCGSSVLGNLIKSYTSCEYDNEKYFHAKVAASLFTVHVIGRLATGDSGTLSVSLLQKIHEISKKLNNQPAFSELLAQYSQRGYSEGKELKTLILSDLYYHFQGEFEGREIAPGAFKELLQYLVESKFLQSYHHKYDDDLFATSKDVYLFDLARLRADMGLDMWDCSEWKASKTIAETMLHCMQDANSMMLLASSKHSALKALITVLTVYEDDSTERKTIGRKIPDQLVLSCIDHICQCFYDTVESLAPILDASEDILCFLVAQIELLLHLMRSAHKSLSLHACALVLKTSASGLKVLGDLRPSVTEVNTTMELLLMLVLSTLEFTCLNSRFGGVTDVESVEELAKISNATITLLPILCNCITTAEHCTLSLTTMDFILRSFLTPNTWFPIIQSHLQLQHVILKLQDKNSFASIPILLKFFLTLARVRGGAEMLLNSGFLSSLRVLFSEYLDGESFSSINSEGSLSNSSDKSEKPQHIWGLGLAVVTAIIQSLGDSSTCTDIVDNVIPYFFTEKAYIISYYLNAPDFPSGDPDKKRPRAQRTQTSLAALEETEHTLTLMCVLAKHWNSWVKAMKEMDSQLREKSIHLLAFISRGTQHHGESAIRGAPLLCPPTLKEDFDLCKKAPFIKSKNGWFALSPLGCVSKQKFTAVSTALTIKDQANTVPVTQTYFSDAIALQIYRITFLLLKFLSLQAEGATRRAEEVGFVDLAHFPELPMPEILHGLQDQAVAIVTELCEANRSERIPSEIKGVCCLLLQIMEMALYLELCVVQICGIRPVLGRVEDFSKDLKLLIRATEGHAFLKASMKSLKHIISFVYPGLLQSEGFL